MGNYQAYEKYKNSGVEWLGKIPEHWQQKRMKFAVELINNKIDAENSDLPYMGLEQIESWTGKRIENENASSEGVGSHFLPNDVLFGKLRPYLAKVYLSELEGLASTEALVLRNREKVNAVFLKYYILSRDFINIVNSSTFGSKMPRASWDFIGNLLLSIPPLDEQQSIANFLDRKTKQIDDLIAKKEALLTKLDEKRSAIISHAVTKGLDPTVPMKDSGIEWLGNIPKHWEVKKLKRISPSISVGLVINPSTYVSDDGTIPFLFGSNIVPEGFRLEDVRLITEKSNDAIAASMLFKDDLVTVRVGAPGITAVIPLELDRANCASMLIIRKSPNFVSKFLCKCMNSIVGKFQVDLVAYGAAQKQFNVNHAVDFIFPLPFLKEQKEISEYLDKKTEEIDLQKAKVQEAIERLKEYRTALITNAVTGKIDVRQVSLN